MSRERCKFTYKWHYRYFYVFQCEKSHRHLSELCNQGGWWYADAYHFWGSSIRPNYFADNQEIPIPV